MKREYIVDLIAEFLWKSNDDYGFKKYAKEDAENLLIMLEKADMFYCPVEDLGDFGKLRTPKGFDEE
jgi:hypothetical protein